VIAVKIFNKDRVDYRYSDTASFQEISIPREIIDFCLTISRLEQNPLIGIDLIQTVAGYVFLEANPMPGWDYFF
jgi:glutathione synthase/RimK-type ligase-like ATP-grasp enzyme